MQNSQLIRVLRSLNAEEVRELKKWVASPSHNQRPDVDNMIGYLLSANCLYSEKKTSKKQVYAQAYPKTKYDDAKLRQTIYFAMRALEDFLTYKELQSDSTYVNLLLTRSYRKRQLGKMFQKEDKQLNKKLEKAERKDKDYWQHLYLLQNEEFSFFGDQKRGANEFDLQTYSNTLDLSYMAQKMKQLCNMYSKLNVYRSEEELKPFWDVTKYIEQHGLADIYPAIGVYYYGYKTLTDSKNSDHFYRLKGQIKAFSKNFRMSEAEDLYLLAINYCIRGINSGKNEFAPEAFELYSKALEQGLLISNKNSFRWTYGNIISFALRLNKFNWTKTFIAKYSDYLPEDYRDGLVNFNTAKLLFEQKKYKEAMPLLLQVDYKDVLFTLISKSMLLRMYYEEGEEDALESLLDSSNTYINRKKVIGYHRDNHKNLIKLTKKLVKLNVYDRIQVKKLYHTINDTNPLTERDWLLRQLEKAAPAAYKQISKPIPDPSL